MWGRQMQSLYISRVVIKNFRNFMDVDVKLGHKQVIIGENNIGKTNFLRALQLILDPTLSDEDRMLQETDFNEQIKNPMENKEEILIQILITMQKTRQFLQFFRMLQFVRLMEKNYYCLPTVFILILMKMEMLNINIIYIRRMMKPENLVLMSENT